MATMPMVLLTIIAEDVLEPRLLRAVREHGATGYTITDARGEGARGLREGAEGSNIRVEAIVPEEVAAALIEHLREHYFPYYAVIAWLSEVRVVREGKYRGRETPSGS